MGVIPPCFDLAKNRSRNWELFCTFVVCLAVGSLSRDSQIHRPNADTKTTGFHRDIL